MVPRAIAFAFFGFTAIVVGAAFSWSLIGVVGMVFEFVTTAVPARVHAFYAVEFAIAAVVLTICVCWIYAAIIWLRRLPTLRTLSAAFVGAPFLFGALTFAWGPFVSMWAPR
jgi:NAD/NADP transhydrogenase beta subunit